MIFIRFKKVYDIYTRINEHFKTTVTTRFFVFYLIEWDIYKNGMLPYISKMHIVLRKSVLEQKLVRIIKMNLYSFDYSLPTKTFQY